MQNLFEIFILNNPCLLILKRILRIKIVSCTVKLDFA